MEAPSRKTLSLNAVSLSLPPFLLAEKALLLFSVYRHFIDRAFQKGEAPPLCLVVVKSFFFTKSFSARTSFSPRKETSRVFPIIKCGSFLFHEYCVRFVFLVSPNLPLETDVEVKSSPPSLTPLFRVLAFPKRRLPLLVGDRRFSLFSVFADFLPK